MLITVKDENGVVVPSARVLLVPGSSAAPLRGFTDFAGRQQFTDLTAGSYRLEVQKEGFYEVSVSEVQVGVTESVDVTLNHIKEYKESVHVVYSPQTIEPSKTASSAALTNYEVLQLPYPTTRDIRNLLPLMPGVLPDAAGQVHVNGSASNEVVYTLDGFDVTQPFTGQNDLRISTDAVRGIDVEGSRTSAEFGRGSGGELNLETRMGDNHFRFSATDFIPSVQNRRGFHLQNVTPRFSFSGPIRRGRAWFYEAVEGEYDLNIHTELPPGQDRDHFWRASNLVRTQFNLSQSNRLAGSFVFNRSGEDHAGLSIIQPLSTTTRQSPSAYVATLKDQATWANGMLAEFGFGYIQYNTDEQPLGTQPYVVTPGSARGNFYRTSNSQARRYEMLAHVFLPAFQWHGGHQLLVGTNLERTLYDQFAERRPFTILRADGTLARSVSFTGGPRFARNNFDAAAFVQDRWSPTERLTIEAGLRLSGDEILRKAEVAPRLAAAYMLTADGETKLSAGVGIYYDRTSLDLVSRLLSGQRQDVFFAADGVTPVGPPVVTQFQANLAPLDPPRFLNWSVALERKLPAAIYLKAEYLEKRETHGLDYENQIPQPPSAPPSGLFLLRDNRRDRYDAFTITLRRTFRQRYTALFSYTRSDARSNAVLDSGIDDPLFGPQLGGPLEWDSPNRIVSWGWLPLGKGFDFAYSFDWHTGYPYSLVNAEQQLVGLPDRNRFPDFAALNLHVEKRFHLFGFQWAIRAGFNNITGRKNPSVVNNNVDSPQFGAFGGFQHRAFTGRIRFLGRK